MNGNSIKDIQTSLLSIIKVVDEIFKKEKIWYSLACGSVLGAVRHNGFIPWDNDLDIFAKQSQISQAEALKFFIEHFRIQKWSKSGLLWWNISDGWPQVSEAVVDWYGCKKLAYSFVKRSQSPLCMMFDEPKDGKIDLYIVNDTQSDVNVKYTVKNVVNDKIVAKSECFVKKNSLIITTSIDEEKGAFYLIVWDAGNFMGVNHYTCSIADKIDYNSYIKNLEKVGFDKYFEGFDNN